MTKIERIYKAVAAGTLSALTAVVLYAPDLSDEAKLIGGLIAAVGIGLATWRIPNKP